MDNQKIAVVYNLSTGEILYPVFTNEKEEFDNNILESGQSLLRLDSEIDYWQFRVDVTAEPHSLVALIGDELPDALEEFRQEKLRIVDMWAGDQRSAYFSICSFQETIYQKKHAAAVKCIDDPNPQPENYPIFCNEIGITGESLQEISAIILQKSKDAETALGLIEANRMTKKKAINSAQTIEEIQNILSSL